MNQRQFYDAIWAYKLNIPGHKFHDQMCSDIVGEDWDSIMYEVFKRLCEKHGLNPLQDQPFIDMQMEDHNWITHAKNVGVFKKRTRSEALSHKQKLDDQWVSHDFDDYPYGHALDVDMVFDNEDGTQTRISYDPKKDRDVEIIEPLKKIT